MIKSFIFILSDMAVTRLHILLVFNPLSGVQNRQIILEVFLSRMVINMNVLKQKMNVKIWMREPVLILKIGLIMIMLHMDIS